MFWHIYVVCFQPNLPWSIDHFPAGCWHWRLAWCFFVFVWACWRLVPHRSKLKNGNSCSWQQITFGTECWIFCGKMLGKSPVFWLGYAFFLVRLTVGPYRLICMCFLDSFGPVDGGFLTGPKIKIEKKPFFLKDRAQYCTMNIMLHAHLHRTRTTHIIFKLVLQSR